MPETDSPGTTVPATAPPAGAPRGIAIVGGGISGLAAAHRLTELAPGEFVRLFEASPRLGGVLRTEQQGDLRFEWSADMFTTTEPWAIRLCERIGFAAQLIGTNAQFRRAFVVCRGRLEPVPMGFSLMTPSRMWPMLKTPLLSLRGKLRMGWEYFVPAKRDESDESLASFSRRRLGREAYERIVQPLVGGIYTADPEQLSMSATLERFCRMEREHGGLIRATLARRRTATAGSGARPETAGVRYDEFVTPRDGFSSLVAALAARLPAASLALNSPVRELTHAPDGTWRVTLESGAVESFTRVILATPAPHAARLLRPFLPEAATRLEEIPMASAAIAVLAYRRDQVGHPLDGFGFVVPIVERRRILAGSFSSIKFAGRAPDDQVLFRVFVGGAIQPELFSLPDDSIFALVDEELRQLLRIQGRPVFQHLVRWPATMPQYHVGHRDRIASVERTLSRFPTLRLAGNAYHGVGIPYCVRSGEAAAESCLATNRSVEMVDHQERIDR